jgi:hypothetical protein
MNAGSILKWHWGWTQNVGEFKMPFPWFWLFNFGLFLPLAIALVWIILLWPPALALARIVSPVLRKIFGRGGQPTRVVQRQINLSLIASKMRSFELSIDATFLIAAVLIFLLTISVKTAPWEWDNTKLLIWAYFITLPILWQHMLAGWPLPARAGACLILFFSGFVSLIGGLNTKTTGYDFANRSEVDLVAATVRRLPVEARFAGFPTYNHPLLLNGRKMVCGYGGHLWTQGINSTEVEGQLRNLMLGVDNWKQTARELQVRYLFWGNLEKANYAQSTRPWEKQLPLVAQGSWGSIYDFGAVAKRQ